MTLTMRFLKIFLLVSSLAAIACGVLAVIFESLLGVIPVAIGVAGLLALPDGNGDGVRPPAVDE